MSATVMIVLCPFRGMGHFALKENRDDTLSFLIAAKDGSDEIELANSSLSQYFDLENNSIHGIRTLGFLDYEDSDVFVKVVIASEELKDSQPQGLKWVSEGELMGLISNGKITSTLSVAAYGLFTTKRSEFGSLIL